MTHHVSAKRVEFVALLLDGEVTHLHHALDLVRVFHRSLMALEIVLGNGLLQLLLQLHNLYFEISKYGRQKDKETERKKR